MEEDINKQAQETDKIFMLEFVNGREMALNLRKLPQMLKIVLVNEEGPELEIIRQLFRDYEAELDENICFQSFEKELENPLIKYGGKSAGLWLAYYNNEVAGCIGLLPLAENAVCEMKRLYVKPAFRKYGIGRALVELILEEARAKGHKTMVLDTLPKLQAAISLYKTYGFTERDAYYNNPLEGVIYLEKKLQSAGIPI